jgi:hypothetical protein
MLEAIYVDEKCGKAKKWLLQGTKKPILGS